MLSIKKNLGLLAMTAALAACASNPNDLPDYESYDSHACPWCKAGQKIDALVNSFGYSSL